MKLTNVFEGIAALNRVQQSYFTIGCNATPDSKVYDFRSRDTKELYKFFTALDNHSIKSFYAMVNDAETLYLFQLYFCTDRKTADHEPIYDLTMSYNDIEDGVIETQFWSGELKIPTSRNIAASFISAVWKQLYR